MLTHLIIINLAVLPLGLSAACGDAVYWGQNGIEEGTLEAACNSKSSGSKSYAYVNVGFLSTFGNGNQPILNLPIHCPNSGPCPQLGANISACQSQNVKVFLSLGGPTGSYTLSSENDAQEVASYLYQNYLSGNGGPLGDSNYFDGIDFNIQNPGSPRYWDSLATALSQFSTPTANVFLSASPRCPLPDPNLDAAIKTKLFNYVWVQFYDNPTCDIRSSSYGLIASFQKWSSYLATNSPGSQLSMGLPASNDAAKGGYIDPNVFTGEVLPEIKQANNYGGLMLWNRYYDASNSYSNNIVSVVCSGETRDTPELLIAQVV